MSEFLYRGYNVAIPEVDVGDDIFVVKDEDGTLTRIQVKSANGKPTQKGFYAHFNVPLTQLQAPKTPPLYYIFAARHQARWNDYVIIKQNSLEAERVLHNVGTLTKQRILVIRLTFTDFDVSCKGRSLLSFRNNWDRWPQIMH